MSDDSDIEVHPNVDKKSFIRAKQNQIHQQRFERKHKIETYKYERILNDGLLLRINSLLKALQSHTKEAEKRSPDELMFQAIMEAVGDSDNDLPPPPPAGVHSSEGPPPAYSKMMATLIDQVKAKVEEDGKTENKFEAYIAEVQSHRDKVQSIQAELMVELNTLEAEEGKKITSEGYKTGFNSSAVAKNDTTSTGTAKNDKVQAVELLNPNAAKSQDESSGADADVDDDDEDAEIEATAIGKEFAKIKFGDYRASMNFISQNPSVLKESETDGLLVMAFNAAIDENQEFAQQCVHQALLLQYCRSLGKDGVPLFFKRITTQGHQAQKVFFDDVKSTYQRIRVRAKELERQRIENEANGGAGVEQIQLHAVDPDTEINITVPPVTSEDPDEVEARRVFNSFPPGLQKALDKGSLDDVNKVLGKMSVEEAEEVVRQLGEVKFCSVLAWQVYLD